MKFFSFKKKKEKRSGDVKERRSASCQQNKEREEKKKQVKVCHFLSLSLYRQQWGDFTAHLIRFFSFAFTSV
jgi:hypothetical protein